MGNQQNVITLFGSGDKHTLGMKPFINGVEYSAEQAYHGPEHGQISKKRAEIASFGSGEEYIALMQNRARAYEERRGKRGMIYHECVQDEREYVEKVAQAQRDKERVRYEEGWMAGRAQGRREQEQNWPRESEARAKGERDEEARRQSEQQRAVRKRYNEVVLDRWNLYQAPLAEGLSFDTVVWPVLTSPVAVYDLSLAALHDFAFSKVHSKDKSNKERLRDTSKRWHTDKCAVVKSRVSDQEKPLID